MSSLGVGTQYSDRGRPRLSPCDNHSRHRHMVPLPFWFGRRFQALPSGQIFSLLCHQVCVGIRILLSERRERVWPYRRLRRAATRNQNTSGDPSSSLPRVPIHNQSRRRLQIAATNA